MTVASAMRFYIFWTHRVIEITLDEQHSTRSKCSTDNLLADLPYPIAPNDVHLYEDRLQININVFSFFDEEGKARHPLFISRKQYPRTANLLYWDEHYAPITDISRLFNDLTKHDNRVNMCLRCLGRFYTPESLEKHQRLCTREDFMSVVHVLPAPDTEQAHIKFRQFRNTFRAPFVIYADFESILEPMERRVKQTLYNQQHKISAACAMLVTSITGVSSSNVVGEWRERSQRVSNPNHQMGERMH